MSTLTLEPPSISARPGCCARCDARVAEAAARERRRLERNLHDGAQQRLVGLALQLQALGTQLEPGSDAERMLAAAEQELAASLSELRQLARGLDPAVIGGHGLGGALRSVAARSPLPVDVVVDAAGRLPADVETAAFYVVSEALTNVAKHAHATHATVTAAVTDGTLVVSVSDDGIGGACDTDGSGLRGLAERADAAGGDLRVASRLGGGTTVTAALPI